MSQPWNQPASPYTPYPQYTTSQSSGAKLDSQVESTALWALALAICSYVVWFVPAIAAIFLALGSLRNIAASDGYRTGRGYAIAAIAVSGVAMALEALAILLLAVL